jgi:hypothetical protein
VDSDRVAKHKKRLLEIKEELKDKSLNPVRIASLKNEARDIVRRLERKRRPS